MNKESLLLYLVTDSSMLRGRSMQEVVMQAVKGGVTMVQLREKDICTSDFVDLAQSLKTALYGTGSSPLHHISTVSNMRNLSFIMNFPMYAYSGP